MLFTIKNLQDGSELVSINPKNKTVTWTKVAGEATVLFPNESRKFVFDLAKMGFIVGEEETAPRTSFEQFNKNSFIRKQKLEELATEKGIIISCEESLQSNLQQWERKEYEAVQESAKSKAFALELHIVNCDRNKLW